MTKDDKNPNLLTLQQEKAINLLIAGQSVTQTAKKIGVARQTVSQWFNHNVAFREAINERREAATQAAITRLHSLLDKAVDQLEKKLDDWQYGLRASVIVLKACNLIDGSKRIKENKN